MKKESFGSQERDEDMFDVSASVDKRLQPVSAKDLKVADMPEMEVMTSDEMREQIIAKMRDLSSKIAAEESIASDIHKMGAEVNSSTRDRINALDAKQKALIDLHKKTLAPLFKENFVAIGRGEEILVPKPEEWDSLMSDDEYVLELGPSMQKHKSSIELQTKESQLREEAKQTEKNDRRLDRGNACKTIFWQPRHGERAFLDHGVPQNRGKPYRRSLQGIKENKRTNPRYRAQSRYGATTGRLIVQKTK